MERINIVNPYDEQQRDQIREYEEQLARPIVSPNLNQIKNTNSQEEYRKAKKESNIIEEYITLEESKKIKGICHIHGEKDRKTCQIIFIGKKDGMIEKRLLSLATEYAMNSLGMIEVFLNIDKPSKELEKYLLLKGYENLGEENGKKIFLKEKNDNKISKETDYETTR